jgi:hypothetical protein
MAITFCHLRPDAYGTPSSTSLAQAVLGARAAESATATSFVP